MAFTLKRVKPEALEVGDTIHITPYDLRIDYNDRYGLPATFRRGPFERVLKAIDLERLL